MSRANNFEEDDLEDLEDLFESAPCGYVSADAKGRITKVNQTLLAWLGHERAQLHGQRFQDFLNIAGKIYYETHFAPLLRMQGFFNEVALDLVRADGTAFPVLVNAVERRDDTGEVRFIRMTVFNASDRRRYERELLEARNAAEQASAELRDLNLTLEQRINDAVQERLRAEDQIRQMQKMEAVGQLTGGIAHDFNNMLAIVIGGLNLVQRRLAKGDTDVGQFISGAMEGANRAATLTQRLLAFSRQQPLSPQALKANDMVSDMSELLRRTLGETIQMETVLAGGLWQTYADAGQLENVVLNLAVNARDAMPDGGRLTIETANCHLDSAYAAEHGVTEGQYVLVAVTDNGSGMPPEVAAKAFDPFFTTKGVGKGTGLGLSQVFGFVKQSGGHVKIYSEPDHGTSVKIYLPRYYGNAEAPARTLARGVPYGNSSEVILVVEDDSRVRELAVHMLRDLGYGVLEAEDGACGLQMLDRHPEVCLLFTDVVMPGMSGRLFADVARQRKPELRVLFTTGYSRNAIVHNGVLDPGVHLLPKPASLEQLALKVREVLDE
ncbi:PAS domain-containing hybrid sensor histidine kinase/response regulator [Aurantimonas coralicida]|uniref:PAS domain-containing hybrid sensor histidine kinase/response regulator n=1 Tax=Aurantimonas coralicida TaxID=182270 RepID=UPI001E4C3C70|nr:PAS domain-containing hybrid sensor histidine kinase/response regulator [Aurantimonas coralicida]MCD1642043.1 response regulator [Aurantimonas coralicida]